MRAPWLVGGALALALFASGCGALELKKTPGATPAELRPDWWQGDDFAWVRGANYVPSWAKNDVQAWADYDAEIVERELGYAAQLGLNSVRVFLQVLVFERDPEAFLANFEDFLARCGRHGLRAMPVLFDSCFGKDPFFEAQGWVANPGPTRVAKESWPGCERYVDALVGAYLGDPRILIWDVMNEPMVAGPLAVDQEGRDQIWRFARHFAARVAELDRTHPTTIGVSQAAALPFVAEHVDVLSFHAYTGDERLLEEYLKYARTIADETGRSGLIVSELGNYEFGQALTHSLATCRAANAGFYFWELMIGRDQFSGIQGQVYPDGRIRSPEEVAAILGFQTRRDQTAFGLDESLMDRAEFDAFLERALAIPTRPEHLAERLAFLRSARLHWLTASDLLRAELGEEAFLARIQRDLRELENESAQYRQSLTRVRQEIRDPAEALSEVYLQNLEDPPAAVLQGIDRLFASLAALRAFEPTPRR